MNFSTLLFTRITSKLSNSLLLLLRRLLYHRIIASFIFFKSVFLRPSNVTSKEESSNGTISFVLIYLLLLNIFFVYVHSRRVFVVTVDYMCVTRNNALSPRKVYVYDRNRNRVGKNLLRLLKRYDRFQSLKKC